MWPALIGLGVSLLKAFATSALTSAGGVLGTKAFEAAFRHLGEAPTRTVVAAVEPGATREQQLNASQQLLSALKTDEAFRNEVRAILAQDDPDALQAGEFVEKHLETQPAVVQQVVSGSKPVTDFMDPLWIWSTADSTPLSAAQAAFLRSPTFNRVCPVGGEDLGIGPEVMGGTRYLWETGFGTTQEVRLPTVVLPAPHSAFFAVCKNGHRWPVFAA